jgi:transposase-like protein
MKYTIAKKYEKETRCLHCLEMLKMSEKWLMSDDTQSWTCYNCGSNWLVNGGTNKHHLENANTLHITHSCNRSETNISVRLFQLVDNCKFEEVEVK